jgi:diguanylate cyclase (GGDEF)-like protein
MKLVSQTMVLNAGLLKAKVNKSAVYGVLIAILAILIATALASLFQFGEISLEGVVSVQKTNIGLWGMNAMPFLFAIWGQYTGAILSYEASAMLIDQTQELRDQTSVLERKAMHAATHDALTNLPNRVLFHDRVTQAIRSAKREKRKLAIMLLDLDHFKEINDTMGHYNGDLLLKQVAVRLDSVRRKSDTLARLGGDEFAIMLSVIISDEDTAKVAEKIRSAMRQPFILEGLSIDVQASVGAVVFPTNGENVDTLLQRVDVAMYVAKKHGKGFVVYSPQLDEYSPKRLTLIGELRHALENDELVLHYQPKVDSKSDKIIGAEALVRWNHPIHGLMPPDKFISLAERSGLIRNLTHWVLKNALRQGVSWRDQGLDMEISVNLSARNLLDPDLPDVVAGLMASYDFPPESLMLEITETMIMTDPDKALEVLNRIAQMGVHFSIDDFGTGYSSLSYLKKLPISEIKIDKSFVMEMIDNENDTVIVHATIGLAHNLGLKVVAEGVESREILDKLKALGCDVLQGFYINQPMDAESFTAWNSSSEWEKLIVH